MRTKNFDPQTAQRKAMLLFWQKGYAQTSMDELLKALGISRSSFYNTFGDKRQLYQAAIKDFAMLGQMTTQVLQADKPIHQLLLDFFEFSFEKHGISSDCGCLLVNTVLEQQAHDPELVKETSAFLSRIESAIANALQNAVATGELAPTADTEELASLIMTIIKGLRVSAREGKPLAALKTLFTSSLNLLLNTGAP